MVESRKSIIPFSFSASSVLQLAGAFAAYLAAFVLPLNFSELRGSTSVILAVIGTIFLVTGIANILFGRHFLRLAQYIGMRSRVLLPREGLVYLGVMLMLAVGALLGHSNMLLLVFGMMAGPFVLNGWVVITMLHKVAVSRQLPVSASDGEVFSVELTLKNEKAWLSSRLIEVRDVVEGGRLREEAEVTFVHIPPKSGRSGVYQLQIFGRGIYRFGPLRVSSRFPLGIGERGMTVNDRAELYVHPATGRLLPDWLRRERELSESMNHLRARQGVFDDDFHRVREFRPGDNPRSIHWRTSARRGEMMVKEYEQHRDSDLIVLLDLFQMPDVTSQVVEMAVSLAATICNEQTRRAASGHYRLLIAGRDSCDLFCAGASRFRELALNALAVCQASTKANLKTMLNDLGNSALAATDRCILITPRPQEAMDLLMSMSSDHESRSGSLQSRTTIVAATIPDMLKVFVPPMPERI